MYAFFDVVYLLVLTVLSPAIAWMAWSKGKYRYGLRQKLLGSVPARGGLSPCVWLHAVSVGEVNVISTIVDRLEVERPDVDLYVTTTTRTGYELARKRYARHTVSYCPLDFSWAVRSALRRIRPDVLLLTELELWPNLIRAAGDANVKLGLVNARLSSRSFVGYRRIRWVIKPLLNRLDWATVQTNEYATRFIELGMEPARAVVTGSLKYDGVETGRQNARSVEFRRLTGVNVRHKVFLAGSTQAPEEQIAIDAFREFAETYPELRLIIVPRHPERFAEVAELLDRSGLAWTRRSRLEAEQPVERILMVDTIGELGAWWGLADVAFVGGSMGTRGGQNMIEPAAYGAAVCFGPNTENFRDVVQQLLDQRAATVVRDLPEMCRFLQRCLSDHEYIEQYGSRARRLVLANQGAIDETVEMIHAILPRGMAPTTGSLEIRRGNRRPEPFSRTRKSA